MTDRLWTGYRLIERRVGRWTNEEEVRHAWMKGLEEALQIDLDAERARRDASYNNVVIEFKAPGLFNGNARSPKFAEALEGRLLKYIRRLAQLEGLAEEDYIGLAIDGDHIAFAQVSEGRISHRPLMAFSPVSFSLVVEALRANFRRSITSENLMEDFGHLSTIGRDMMGELSGALAEALGAPGNKKIKMLFEEWMTLYGQAADLSLEQRRKIDVSLGFGFAGPASLALPARLFVTHTFHCLLMKLIAAEIVAAHSLASSGSLIHDLLACESDAELIGRLRGDIENGFFFSAVGLRGFVEEVIFSWYLDAAESGEDSRRALCAAVRRLLARLSVYRFEALDRSRRSRDVLRDFYQDIVPEELRKSLGEFYTPDWLVEHTVGKLNYTDADWLRARLLDPTCGSGSFLLEIIARKRQAAREAGWNAEKTLDMLMATVWGFDLNPLAVQTARVNLLIAVADLLKECKGQDIEIPILLADAVYFPAPSDEGDRRQIEYSIGSRQANLHIVLPAELAGDKVLLDDVLQLMGREVEKGSPYGSVSRALVETGILSRARAGEWLESLELTYNQVLNLHQRHWNGIWFRIIRNFFRSATAGKFDAIVGNPPWVRWSNLPEAYRHRAKPTCERYGIFSDTKFHGGNELDISAMITYTTADKWLAEGGRLAFVVTQTLFQSPSAQGFRRFRLNAADCLRPVSVDDLKEIKPFPDAANKTAVILFSKGKCGRDPEPVYPLGYDVWLGREKAGTGRRLKSLDPSLSLEDILELVEIVPMEANPVSQTMAGAPWAVMKPGRFECCKALFGSSTWVKGRKGITTDLNGVYFVEAVDVNAEKKLVKVRTRPQEGKTALGPPRDFWVEADALFPLAKGAGDLRPCYFRPENILYTFVPNYGIGRDSYLEAEHRYTPRHNPRTYAFFKAHEEFLKARSTYRTRMKGAPFFAVYNVGDYTFAPYKVIWAEMSGSFAAAVIESAEVPGCGPRVYIPDHKLYFADFDEPRPAYYLCGLLHAETVKEMIEAHVVSTNIGDIFKHICLPPYDPETPEHDALADLVKRAHGEAEPAARQTLISEIRAEAAKLIRRAIDQKKSNVAV